MPPTVLVGGAGVNNPMIVPDEQRAGTVIDGRVRSIDEIKHARSDVKNEWVVVMHDAAIAESHHRRRSTTVLQDRMHSATPELHAPQPRCRREFVMTAAEQDTFGGCQSFHK